MEEEWEKRRVGKDQNESKERESGVTPELEEGGGRRTQGMSLERRWNIPSPSRSIKNRPSLSFVVSNRPLNIVPNILLGYFRRVSRVVVKYLPKQRPEYKEPERERRKDTNN